MAGVMGAAFFREEQTPPHFQLWANADLVRIARQRRRLHTQFERSPLLQRKREPLGPGSYLELGSDEFREDFKRRPTFFCLFIHTLGQEAARIHTRLDVLQTEPPPVLHSPLVDDIRKRARIHLFQTSRSHEGRKDRQRGTNGRHTQSGFAVRYPRRQTELLTAKR